MSAQRSSRELSGRVEIEFHRRPNPIKRAAWWSAVGAILVSVAWIGYEAAEGHTAIYQGGDVSTPHAMFENDCANCHSLSSQLLADADHPTDQLTEGTWAPLRRLLGFNDKIHSVSNWNCEVCHTGTLHHSNQWPKHGDGLDELSCAVCHREHEGDRGLSLVSDEHCTKCHTDLVAHTMDGPPHFAEAITNFAKADGHPDFRIEQLLKTGQAVNPERDADGQPIHHAHRVVDFVSLDGDEPKWRDTARIRFNHQAHLKAMFDENGQPISADQKDALKRRKGEHAGELLAYPQACADCHQPDESGSYMRPIVYEQHCAKCHPLTFDAEKFIEQPGANDGPGQKTAVTVPHESPKIVRGFLAELYSLQSSGENVQTKESAADPLADLRQGFPGEDFPVALNTKLAEEIRKQIRLDESEFYPQKLVENEVARMKGQKVLFKENGSCAFCHDIKTPSAGETAAPEIVPPRIPERWYAHSRFQHNSHRMLNCLECHSDLGSGRPIWESHSTGDVLLPSKALCAECHTGRQSTVQPFSGKRLAGARANCVECHNYHDHSKDNFNGKLTLELTGTPAKKTNPTVQTDTK